MKMKCESCGKDGQANVTMPMGFGVFKVFLCLICATTVHEDPEMFMKIIKSRATKKGYKLPLSKEQLLKVLEENVKSMVLTDIPDAKIIKLEPFDLK